MRTRVLAMGSEYSELKGRHRERTLLIVLAIGVVALLIVPRVVEPNDHDHFLKRAASQVYRICKGTQWPRPNLDDFDTARSATVDDTFRIGIIGRPLGSAVDDVLAGLSIGGAPLEIVEPRLSVAELRRCRALVVANAASIDHVLTRIAAEPILIVEIADADGAPSRHVHITIEPVGKSLRTTLYRGRLRLAALEIGEHIVDQARVVD